MNDIVTLTIMHITQSAVLIGLMVWAIKQHSRIKWLEREVFRHRKTIYGE